MRRLSTLSTLIFFLCVAVSAAQVKTLRTIKPVKVRPKTTNFGIGGGLTTSMLFLAQNVKENNNALGYNGTIVYGGTKSNLRVSVEYTHYRKLDIAPTWYNIHANTIEANLHVIARFNNIKAYFYPIVGLSYNTFSGYFTGLNDFLHLRSMYQTDATATKRWMGVNVGTGFERYFNRISIFAEYKMRVGTVDNHRQLSIMDVVLCGGIRYNLKAPTIYRLFKGTRSRYLLDKSGR